MAAIKIVDIEIALCGHSILIKRVVQYIKLFAKKFQIQRYQFGIDTSISVRDKWSYRPFNKNIVTKNIIKMHITLKIIIFEYHSYREKNAM